MGFASVVSFLRAIGARQTNQSSVGGALSPTPAAAVSHVFMLLP
jgi:hypothetical protein